MKKIYQAVIRACRKKDLPGIREISNLVWDGDDYLAEVAEEWIRDGHFYLAEYEGKVVGTDKLTLLPDRVGWLEGLRVHPDYQKHGIGKQLSEYGMQEALKLKHTGEVDKIEFCTFYKNKESISMAEKIGFRVVDSLYLLTRSVSSRKQVPEKMKITESLLKDFGLYLPWGWKSVHNTPAGRKWLIAHGQGYTHYGVDFYIGGLEPIAVIPHLDESRLLAVMPALNHLFSERGEIDILIPGKRSNLIPMLKKHRFHFWCKPEEPNMLIYRLFNGN